MTILLLSFLVLDLSFSPQLKLSALKILQALIRSAWPRTLAARLLYLLFSRSLKTDKNVQLPEVAGQQTLIFGMILQVTPYLQIL